MNMVLDGILFIELINNLKKIKSIQIYIIRIENLTPASTLTFVLSQKLLDGRLRLPFLCNFRANFATALRIGKGTNAG